MAALTGVSCFTFCSISGSTSILLRQVETFFLSDLTDDETVRSHTQRFLDEPAQSYLAGSLEIGVPRLHGDHVRQRHTQLEDLLARDDAFARRDRGAQAIEKSGLPRLRATRDDDVESGCDGGFEKSRRRRWQRPQRDELVERAGGHRELPDVDRPVLTSHIGDDDM